MCLAAKSLLQGGVLQGRFLHFCMEDSYITDPPQYKNVRMTVFILYIYVIPHFYIELPAVIISGYM